MRDNILWNFFTNLLFYKQPITIRSAFGVEESVRRLSKVVRWFPSFYCQSLIGSVKPDRVEARRFIWPPITATGARLIFGFWPIGMMLIFVAHVRLGKWFARNNAAFTEERIKAALTEV